MRVKVCPYCETTIAIKENGDIPEVCPDCGKEIIPKELLNLDIKETFGYVKQTNAFASVLKVLGWVTVVLGLISVVIFKPFGIAYCVAGIISGIMILGFAEMINLLHQINLKMK